MNTWYLIIPALIVIIGAFATTRAFTKNSIGKETIGLMQQNKKAQDDAIFRLEQSDTEKTKQISHLTGQVDLLKDIPLQKISASMEKLAQSHADLTSYMTNHDHTVQDATRQIINHIDSMRGGNA